MTRAADILKLTPAGLHCEAGDFHVDPVRKVARAVITHGHSDHERAGHEAVLATKETLAVMAARYGDKYTAAPQAARFGETNTLGAARVTLRPAGHVIGSAQIVIEVEGKRVIVSGDYKRARDPTCLPFEPVNCDIFITEATFGLPGFRHPPAEREVAKVLHSLRLFPDRPHVIGAYSLGNAQRLIALIREDGLRRSDLRRQSDGAPLRALRSPRGSARRHPAGGRGGQASPPSRRVSCRPTSSNGSA